MLFEILLYDRQWVSVKKITTVYSTNVHRNGSSKVEANPKQRNKYVLALLNDRRVLGNFMKTMQSQGVMSDKYLEVKNNLPEVSKQPALRLRWQYVYRELMRTFPVNYLEIV
jgi:hypothetical protein